MIRLDISLGRVFKSYDTVYTSLQYIPSCPWLAAKRLQGIILETEFEDPKQILKSSDRILITLEDLKSFK